PTATSSEVGSTCRVGKGALPCACYGPRRLVLRCGLRPPQDEDEQQTKPYGDRGREGLRLPALRTARAVFPHAALQSAVSSSGVSRSLPGCVKCEQPGLREECVGPAPMVGWTVTEAGTLALLAQERAQTPSSELVEHNEGGRVRVLEVGEPAF